VPPTSPVTKWWCHDADASVRPGPGCCGQRALCGHVRPHRLGRARSFRYAMGALAEHPLVERWPVDHLCLARVRSGRSRFGAAIGRSSASGGRCLRDAAAGHVSGSGLFCPLVAERSFGLMDQPLAQRAGAELEACGAGGPVLHRGLEWPAALWLVICRIAGCRGHGYTAQGMLFMAAFGIGTWPALVALRLGAGRMDVRMRSWFRRLSPLLWPWWGCCWC
jgi:hypothetical protein